MQTNIKLQFKNIHKLTILFGEADKNLRFIEAKLKVKISARGNKLLIVGEEYYAKLAESMLIYLYDLIESKGVEEVSTQTIDAALKMCHEPKGTTEQDILNVRTRKSVITPYTKAQKQYLQFMEESDIVFAIGSAGTGKTYMAVAMAVAMFYAKKVQKIILSRPAVEAGEKIGFLPGAIREKVDPYLIPVYDCLYEMIPPTDVERYFITKEIEIAPLAFMRGRTLNNAFVILDEAQNTTPLQMKMFLTRLGHGSKMVITGDLTQIDLQKSEKSGLIDGIDRLKSLPEVKIMKFDSNDVVRHPLTTKIIEAYEQS